jgi:arsenite methyltransferase
MNRTNAKINIFAARQLELAPSDRVLEVGFGGGAALRSLIDSGAFVGGVDRSPDMVEQAKVRFSEAVRIGRVDFRLGSIETLPFEAASFGKLYTVNTIYFWRSLDAAFAEIHRVLSPGGRVVVGFVPKERMERMGMPVDIFTARDPDDVIAALGKAGRTLFVLPSEPMLSIGCDRSPSVLWSLCPRPISRWLRRTMPASSRSPPRCRSPWHWRFASRN